MGDPPSESAWTPIEIPSAWQTVLGCAFHGSAWLRKTIDLSAWRDRDETQRLWLFFESVATDCAAWVNGSQVGRHVGDYVPFQFEITHAIPTIGAIPATDACEIVLHIDEIAARPVEPGQLQQGHITKGFHDVISIQHGGIWQPARLIRTGSVRAIPDGVAIRADLHTGSVDVTIETEPLPSHRTAIAHAQIIDPSGHMIAESSNAIDGRSPTMSIAHHIQSVQPWSIQHPMLYTARLRLECGDAPADVHDLRFGFRSIEADGETIRLNGDPIFLRGILHWGHEPKHMAPAPTAAEVRRQFSKLKSMGFNLLSLCMWYAPRHLYELADEMGMLLWQQHPVWQSVMTSANRGEYQQLYRSFMRRDRAHPSVVIVSATCEHPCFEKELAEWWWEAIRSELPDRLAQLQTASFTWADQQRSDLHDEHTYDNSDRWISYLDDLQTHLQTLPRRPFVMGETVLFTSWPDAALLTRRAPADGSDRWWQPRALAHMTAVETQISTRYGDDVLSRFRRQADRHHWLGRKFQVEQFRRYPNHGGLVMNHLRDVPACQCGFMDDLDRWRFTPEDCRDWLDDVILVLCTAHQRRGFLTTESPLAIEVAVSNFGRSDTGDRINLSVEDGREYRADSTLIADTICAPGEVRTAACEIELPRVTQPTRLIISAWIDGLASNTWDLWVFPSVDPLPQGVCVSQGMSFDEDELARDEVERGYSRGFGLPACSWSSDMPEPAALLPDASPWPMGEVIAPETRLIVTNRLTNRVIDFVEQGGVVVLLASKARGGLGAQYQWLFGQAPLVVEKPPLKSGDSEWIVDLLGYDLVRRYARVIPVEDLGIVDQVDPVIRLLYTHDQVDRVRFFDQLFATRIGQGTLVVSSLDHSEGAGAWLLRRLVSDAVEGRITADAVLDRAVLEPFVIDDP